MNIIGTYKLTSNGRVLCENHNIITLLGESFFLHRAIDEEFNPIQYIVLGDSSISANKNDLTLGNETVRKICTKEVNLDTKQIILKCNCSIGEIENTCEIGVANNNILISHDVYELPEDMLDSSMESVDISYIFQLTTLTDRRDWKPATSFDEETVKYNIYYLYEENNVTGVFEKDTKSGYHYVNSAESLKENTGAYYYDVVTGTLYIRTINKNNPKNKEILIQTQ